MAGPLKGIRIVEMGGIGPAPFAAMMLADHGAEVIRVERAGMIGFENDPLRRSRRSIALDLKKPEACEIVRQLAAKADGLIEGYRPGVMERLGLGPDELLRTNPEAGLRSGHRLGSGGSAREAGGPRHQLCRHHRPAARYRTEGTAGGADQLSWRLCGRRDDAGVRNGQRIACGAPRARRARSSMPR